MMMNRVASGNCGDGFGGLFRQRSFLYSFFLLGDDLKFGDDLDLKFSDKLWLRFW